MLMFNQKISKNIYAFVAIILFLTGLVKLQEKQLSELNFTENKTDFLKKEQRLKAKVRFQQKMPAFGFDNLWANWNYLQFVQYFGDVEARNITGYSVVTDYFETVVESDPNFIQSHLTMSSANSLFAVKPEKTIKLLDKALETVKPKIPHYPFFLWTYKATDEILFLGDLEAAKNSYKMAASWAGLRQDELGTELSQRYQQTSKFLATNPDPTQAQIGAWMNILSGTKDSKTQNHALNKLKELGAEITVSPDGKLEIKPPKFDKT